MVWGNNTTNPNIPLQWCMVVTGVLSSHALWQSVMVASLCVRGTSTRPCTCFPNLILEFAYHMRQLRCMGPMLARNPIYWIMHKVIPYTGQEWAGQFRTWDFFKNGMGYSAQQGSRPQTLGYAIADSPVGLLAWIYEKLVGWADHYQWTDDEGLCYPPSRRLSWS